MTNRRRLDRLEQLERFGVRKPERRIEDMSDAELCAMIDAYPDMSDVELERVAAGQVTPSPALNLPCQVE